MVLSTPKAGISPTGWVASELTTESNRAGKLDTDTEAKAIKDDRQAIKEVDRYFVNNAAAVALWGDVGLHALSKWVEVYAGGNPKLKAAVVRNASELRAKLAGANPTALDVLVAERVVLAWFFASWADYQFAAQVKNLCKSPTSELFLHKRCEMAQRSLMTACRTLAQVRRAKFPEVLALINVTPTSEPILADTESSTAGR